MNVRILPEAEEELYQAALSYEDRESEVGLRLLAAYDEARSRIEERADHLQRLETIPPGRNIRRTFMRRFPYMVVCELFPDEVVIIAVAHIRARSQTTGRGELSSQIKSPVPLLVSLGTSSADKELADHRTASPKTPKQWHISVVLVSHAGPSSLLTRNTIDFARIPGLNFEDWTIDDAANGSN